eukprot:scaffold1563_cov44-Cyclotella_meneghiniana.AAC.5
MSTCEDSSGQGIKSWSCDKTVLDEEFQSHIVQCCAIPSVPLHTISRLIAWLNMNNRCIRTDLP